MDRQPCSHCPRVAAGIPGLCIAQFTGHDVYCRLAAEGIETAIQATINFEAPPERTTYSGPHAEPQKPPETPPLEVATLRPSIASVRSKFHRMTLCPHWTKTYDCGCGNNRCSLGKGDRGIVSHKDCFECPDLPPAD